MSAKQEPHPPGECPTCDAKQPAAKGDVEALLKHLDMLADCHNNAAQRQFFRDLAAALRAERERADHHADRHARAVASHSRAVALKAQGKDHLRAVLAMFRDDSVAVQLVAARAFLEGDEQTARHDVVPDDPAILQAARRFETARANKAEQERDALRAELRTEDEAHAHTRARLADVERDLAATKERLADAQHSFKRRADELDYLRAENHKAITAQTRAESEAAQMRADLQFARQQRERLEIAIEGVMRLVEENSKGRS